MREVVYTDEEGRKYKVLIPKASPDSHAQYGIILGPPEFTELNLPTEVEVRLNNQLFNRGIFTLKDALSKRNEVVASLMSALAVDADKIINNYRSI